MNLATLPGPLEDEMSFVDLPYSNTIDGTEKVAEIIALVV